MAVAGAIPFSLALILMAHLVVAEVFGSLEAAVVAAGVALLIAVLWWVLPHHYKETEQS